MQSNSLSSNKTSNSQQVIERFLEGTPININGNQPWDIQVNDDQFYSRVLRQGSIGLGESYMEGLWDCEQLDEFIHKALRHQLDSIVYKPFGQFFYQLHSLLCNLQSKTRAFIVGKKHYDLGNDLFQLMLDQTMCYSCGYWKGATTLHEAQVAKLDLIAQKLQLKEGMQVLDIGCGWGSFAEHAARNYGCEVTGITISEKQAEFARERCKGLPVKILLQDYRCTEGKYDRITSIGMFEHVGYKNYGTYFNTVKHLLADDGYFVLHTIGTNDSHIGCDPWLNKYIFPNGVLPSIAQLVKPTEKVFVMEDWQNFGSDYDRTLMAWYQNLEQAWPRLSNRYDKTTFRMLRYYLLACAGAFRARSIQLWQVVFSNYHVDRYDAPR